MTVPSHPFELVIYGRDGRVQSREYQNIATAMEAVRSLRPAIVLGWRLVLVIDTFAFPRERRRVDAETFTTHTGVVR